ncbi:hypothetical protein [Paenibacillus nasutitermitis]|uniref:hypothetical protein n=1 Tax=Paenibacillus nasutitermitis TaxID=1652958 RepID=UPI001668A1FC|nr:hypothetical protein [Paenibacillus nasutitermitis]
MPELIIVQWYCNGPFIRQCFRFHPAKTCLLRIICLFSSFIKRLPPSLNPYLTMEAIIGSCTVTQEATAALFSGGKFIRVKLAFYKVKKKTRRPSL